MRVNQHFVASRGKLVITLVLAVTHLLAGFSILMVSSWFIAACSIAGLGFNYMLPAVVIRALAIVRIGSGYFSMLFGHSHLLGKLAEIRLNIFAGLHNKVSVSREESLDVLHHQSEEVAAIWMSWVGQNAGAFLSLLALTISVLAFVPEISNVVLGFSVMYALIYLVLLHSMVYQAATLIAVKKQLQFDIIKHVETAPLWHLYSDYQTQAPSMKPLKRIASSLQQRVRFASLLLFVAAMIAISSIFSLYAFDLSGNVLFIILPVALLSINDWLSPTLANQTQLLSYLEARRAISDTDSKLESLSVLDVEVKKIEVSDFYAADTRMTAVDASFELNTTNVIIGSSGVGKSRFLQALSGLLRFEGLRKVDVGLGSISSQGLLSDSFYLEQFPYVLSDTLEENLRVVNRNASNVRLLTTLEQAGLGHLTNLGQWLGEHGLPLSGGERKRLGLARAMLSDANILLFDEPFESLDEQNIEKVVQIINDLASKKMIVLATHILPSNLQYHQYLSLDSVALPRAEKVISKRFSQ